MGSLNMLIYKYLLASSMTIAFSDKKETIHLALRITAIDHPGDNHHADEGCDQSALEGLLFFLFSDEISDDDGIGQVEGKGRKKDGRFNSQVRC